MNNFDVWKMAQQVNTPVEPIVDEAKEPEAGTKEDMMQTLKELLASAPRKLKRKLQPDKKFSALMKQKLRI